MRTERKVQHAAHREFLASAEYRCRRRQLGGLAAHLLLVELAKAFLALVLRQMGSLLPDGGSLDIPKDADAVQPGQIGSGGSRQRMVGVLQKEVIGTQSDTRITG